MQEPFPNFPTEPPQKPAGEPLPPQEETPAPPTEQPVPPVQNPLPPVQNNPVPPVQNPLPPVQGTPQNNPIPPVQNPLPPVQNTPQNNPIPPMQNPIPNWYQNQQPTMGNWQIPPQVPPAPAAATASDTDRDETAGSKVIIQQQDKPELDKNAENTDADGAYTVEGVASVVCPSIVEIETYGDAKGEQLSGTGSGIISSEDGYIITNAHVLTNGKSFRVIMSDETEYPATVIGKDNKTDLAVIKIEGSDFPAAVMGNSDEVVLGESVVAIGNPAGLSGSVTNGIVSGLNRQIRSDATGFDMNCIQTNAAISPGNSGGALVNMYGQVIGITSSKYVSSSYEGLGFAITINEVLPIVQDLIDNGYVADRVRVGITFISLIPEEVRQGFADEIGMKTVPDNLSGVWITEIADDCDIASTDLQVNDVIVSVQGEAVDDYDSLNAAIAGLKGGDTIEARCRRYQPDGNFEEFSIQCKLMADTSGNY